MIRIRLNIFVFLLCTSIVLGQSINFKKEIIEIKIQDGYCILTGNYFFENNELDNTESLIYYPFVINNSLPYPDSISVFNFSTQQLTSYQKIKNGISFNVKIEPESITQIKVIYKQKVTDNYFEYILTTTLDWKKPLESAEFNILLPHSCLNQYISYKEDSIINLKNFICYTLTKTNFLPEKNLIIRWENEE
jgi:hypothetical protein